MHDVGKPPTYARKPENRITSYNVCYTKLLRSIVVSDVRMMPMDGITLLKEIRARLPNLPVLLMTAYAEVEKAVDAMRSGACDFLLKPFEPSALLGHIRKYELAAARDDGGVIAEVV